MLEVTALLDDTKESLEIGFRQELGQLAFCLRLAQAKFPSGLLADVDEIGIAEPLLAGEANDLGNDLRFRLSVW
jgi:hypothetical protein